MRNSLKTTHLLLFQVSTCIIGQPRHCPIFQKIEIGHAAHCYVAILFTYPQTINPCNGSVSKIKASNVFLNSFQKVSVQFTSKNTCIEKFTKKLLSLVQNNQHPLLIRSFHLSTHPMLRLLLVRMRLPANTDQWRIQNPVKHARWSVWRLLGFQPLTVFAKNFILHV